MMQSISYEIVPYEFEKFKSLVIDKVKDSQTTIKNISDKSHFSYFKSYFDYLSAKTIVRESHYIDDYFLEDFSGFYSKCFHPYDRICSRFHFFNDVISTQEFDNFFESKNDIFPKKLSDSYLGFIVIKNLPITIIGRTCLKIYPPEERRNYPITRKYNVNLFGIPLEIKETLAFQEQDRGTAACATTAIWCVFQGTGKLYQHPILSPIEITKLAGIDETQISTIFPSAGLTVRQMIRAIRSMGLECILIDPQPEYSFKAYLYAYLMGHIPLLLTIRLYDKHTKKIMSGGHAIAITGFSLGGDLCSPPSANDAVLRSSKIDKIYVHDDQVGPFARMSFDGERINLENNTQYNSLSTSFPADSTKKEGDARAIQDILLIPFHNKIRVTFDTIYDIVSDFDLFLEQLKLSKVIFLPNRLEWQLFLTSVQELKSDILKFRQLDSNSLREILLALMPLYVWRAIAYCAEDKVFELIFDTTDVKHGNLLLFAIEYNSTVSSVLRIVSKEPFIKEILEGRKAWNIIKWFSERE